MPRCDECHFSEASDPPFADGTDRMFCHRFPPSDSKIGFVVVWPDWWCGEFKPQEKYDRGHVGKQTDREKLVKPYSPPPPPPKK